MRKNKKALNSNSGIYYKREISVFDFSMLQFNKEGSLMHGNEMFLIILSKAAYLTKNKLYSHKAVWYNLRKMRDILIGNP